jgi:hypothetical protein
MVETLLISILILLVCVALLSIKVLLKKDGRFPSMHIDGNKALNKKGIFCAKTQDKEERQRRDLESRMNEL